MTSAAAYGILLALDMFVATCVDESESLVDGHHVGGAGVELSEVNGERAGEVQFVGLTICTFVCAV